MHLRLALVVDSHPLGCAIRSLDEDSVLPAVYSGAVQDRVKIQPGQLVAVDHAVSPPTVVWRWFRGRIVFRQDDYVVVNNRLFQPGLRAPISVVRVPDALEVEVGVGDDVFYSLGIDGVVVDTVAADRPAHPGRIAADLFPALEDVYAELREQEGF